MAEPIGTVAELWRYPVKGMQGERLRSVELDAHGIAGDRRLAFESASAPRGKPLLTGAERAAMLRYAARTHEGTVRVTTPAGNVYRADDAMLLEWMKAHLPQCSGLSLRRADAPQTDVRPLALLGQDTVMQLAQERNLPLDARRFRANLLLNLQVGFAEDGLTGCLLQIGVSAVVRVLERTPRCRIVTLDPETALPDATLMKHLDHMHSGRVGVYAAVVRPGSLREDDPVRLL